MIESMQIISYWYGMYFADGFYLVLALFSYVYLFAHCPELRKWFLTPMAVVMFLVLNPVLYKYFYSRIIYWRLFWMFPTGLLIALAVVKLVKNSSGKLSKVLVLAAICGLILVKGTNVYAERGFSEIQNPEKVPAEVKEICDIMLELEENPRCIVPQTLFCDVRQYSGEIELMYGRDVYGYIIPAPAISVYAYNQMEVEKADNWWVFAHAAQEGYSFVVMYEDAGIDQELMDTYQFVEVGQVDKYRIYHRKHE